MLASILYNIHFGKIATRNIRAYRLAVGPKQGVPGAEVRHQ
jgi:hypothetical protein